MSLYITSGMFELTIIQYNHFREECEEVIKSGFYANANFFFFIFKKKYKANINEINPKEDVK